MASTQKLSSGKWRARYRDDSGREHARHFARKVDAQAWLDEVTAAMVTGQYVDPRAGKVTLRQYAEGWQSLHVGREATAAIIDNALRVHILPALGDRTVASLRRSDVQGLVKRVSETLAARTVRNVYDVLNRVLAAAVDDRVIAVSPARRITLPAVEDSEVVPPTAADVAALAAAVAPRYRALVVLLAGSGVRIGEALGLEVSDVDFLRRTARVERQRLQSNVVGPTKTAKSTRTVPLGQVVVNELAAHLAEYPSDGQLFTTELGTPLTYRQWKLVWEPARLETGVRAKTHDLRHFTASALISGGASVKQVQTVLGHSSAAITLRVYSHLWPGDDDRTRDVMDAALSPLADCVRTEGASHG
ncbi:MAG: site-specific integrase [Actinomycetota bacterium]|nr:site-specific integrase [Actinomycetota bacterium]